LHNQVFLGKSGNFSFWDAKQEVTPACRVEPESAQHIAQILNTVKEKQCHFAIKSGGHARFAGSSNADGGVTIDLVRLNSIKLSSDKKSVTIGAGSRWADVYRSLEAEHLTVIGGRVATVGVGGVILGGKLSFSNPLS
jgi:FAD/FMN-containing dehydrogenase